MTPTEPTVSLLGEEGAMCEGEVRGVGCKEEGERVPYADEVDADIDAEGDLECVGLSPVWGYVRRVHLVREGDLLVIAWGKQADLQTRNGRHWG